MSNKNKISRFFKELKQLFDITNVYVGKSNPQKATINAANFLQTNQSKSFDASKAPASSSHSNEVLSKDSKTQVGVQDIDHLSKDLSKKLAGLSLDKLAPSNDINEIQKHNQQQLNALAQNYRNRLKSVVEKSKESEKQFKQDLNDKFTTLMAQKKKAYRREVQKYHEIIVRLRETISRQRLENQKLRRDHDTWVDELQLLRLEHEDLQDSYQKALAEHQSTKSQLVSLQDQQSIPSSDNNVVDFDMLKVLKEQIQESEALIAKQSATENDLRAEINNLKSKMHGLSENSADQLVNKLNYLGIVGVCYQPGDGHLTIPAEQLINFVKDPGTYTVTHSGVSEDVYKSWLSHVNEPKCNAILPNGQVCGDSVESVGDPLNYQRGISDRCSKHKRKEFTIAINTAAAK